MSNVFEYILAGSCIGIGVAIVPMIFGIIMLIICTRKSFIRYFCKMFVEVSKELIEESIDEKK